MRFKKKEKNFNPIEQTSEEIFIRNYFEIRGIKYKPEFKVFNLIDDKKSHRRIDFYLPNMGVYVEHFGWYNKNKQIRAEYDEKARVLIKNNIPVIILYPHELGFLDYAFHNKMLKVLRVPKFKNNYKMFRYKLNRYTSIGHGYFFFLSFIVLIVTAKLTEDNNLTFDLFFGVGFAMSVLLLWLFFRNIIRVFFFDE